MAQETNLLLKMLKENKGAYVSGQQICDRMGVSRTAVWKHVNVLREMGYVIESATKKGYMLIKEPDILIYDEVEPYLKTKYIGRNYFYFNTVGSTNTQAKALPENTPEGAVVVAEEQTAGRGRTGRAWVSPKGQGIWMSLYLKPDITPQEAPRLTHVAALAVARAIKSAVGISAGIKWPNDIIIDGKKVCGILTELSAEIDAVNSVVVGIGINVNNERFPEGLKDVATSLLIERKKTMPNQNDGVVDRKALLAEVLNNFEKLYEGFLKGDFPDIIKDCKKLSVTIGRPVRVMEKGGGFDALAVDIDDRGALIVKKQDGSTEAVIAGEVSVRGVLGYV